MILSIITDAVVFYCLGYHIIYIFRFFLMFLCCFCLILSVHWTCFNSNMLDVVLVKTQNAYRCCRYEFIIIFFFCCLRLFLCLHSWESCFFFCFHYYTLTESSVIIYMAATKDTEMGTGFCFFVCFFFCLLLIICLFSVLFAVFHHHHRRHDLIAVQF